MSLEFKRYFLPMKKIRITIFCLLTVANIFAQSKTNSAPDAANIVVPYTLADRERLIRFEERTEQRFANIEQRFIGIEQKFTSIDERFNRLESQMNSQYAELKETMRWQFTTLTSLFFILFGFILWDRRQFVKPVSDDLAALKKVLRDYSDKSDSALGEALRKGGFL